MGLQPPCPSGGTDVSCQVFLPDNMQEYSGGGTLVERPVVQRRSGTKTASPKTQSLQTGGEHQRSGEREKHGADSNTNC